MTTAELRAKQVDYKFAVNDIAAQLLHEFDPEDEEAVAWRRSAKVAQVKMQGALGAINEIIKERNNVRADRVLRLLFHSVEQFIQDDSDENWDDIVSCAAAVREVFDNHE